MPQSPKCPSCLGNEIIAQTYRMAAAPHYKCSVCHKLFDLSAFEQVELEWLDKPKEWNAFHGLRPSNAILNGKLSTASKKSKTKKVKK